MLLVSAALIVIALIAIVNALTFPRLNRAPRSPLHKLKRGSRAEHAAPLQATSETVPNEPSLSVLIPARNEAAVIGGTIESLLSQAGVDLEVIVLDDHSDDGTAAAAVAAARGDARLTVIGGEALPDGWLGKNWACHQLARVASRDLLVFADADVRWQPGALRALMDEMTRARADLLTVWSTQQTVTWGERLVVPLMALVVIGYLPVLLVHHTPWRVFAAANGQCLVFGRAAYNAVGGHAAVASEIVEDIALARRIKGHGLRLRMVDGGGLVTCRMYQNWASARDGYAKNIIAGYGGRIRFLALATVFHWLIFLAPWLWLVTGGGWSALALIGLGIGIRALTATVTRQRPADALLLPLSVLMMTIIAARAVWWQWLGGPQWKGRALPRRP